MKVAFFQGGKYDNRPQQRECSWEEFVLSLSTHKEHSGPKDTAPAFSPVEYVPHTTRAMVNVLAVHALVVDLDKIPDAQAFGRTLDILQAYDCIVYTTWSHGPQIKARAVIRLSRPVPGDQWPVFWKTSLQILGFPTPEDPSCKDSCRLYYGPFVPRGNLSLHPKPLVFRGPPFPVPDHIPISAPVHVQTISRDQLQDLATRWQRSKNEPRRLLGQALHHVAQGESFAEPGERDNTLFHMARDLAKAWEGQHLDTQSLAALFAPSIQVMAWPEATPEFVQAKLDRAFRDAPIAQAQNSLLRECWLAAGHPQRNTPYTPDELSSFGDMRHRWLIEREASYYLHGPKGYGYPYGKVAIAVAVYRDLAPAVSAGVQLFRTTATGDSVPLSVGELVIKYGAAATQTHISLSAQRAHYDPETQVFTEAPTPIRLLEPAYDPEVNTWLQLLAGPKYEDLKNWLSLVPDVNQPLCALVFTGAPGVGKSLLAHSLSQLWGNPPCTLNQALSAFNDGLCQSPIVFGDESLPKDFKGHSRTEELREFIGNHSRPLKRKFLPDATLLGCPRIVIAANNPEILGFNQDLTPDDIAAISERFLHIQVRPEARAYLESINPTTIRTDNRLARHVLWLWLHSGYQAQGRFGVQSNSLDMLRVMTVAGGVRSLVCQWLVAYLKNPKLFDNNRSNLVRVVKSQLLVNSGAFVLPSAWGLYVTTEDVPTLSRIKSAVTTLSKGRTKIGPHNYRVIDPSNLVAWAEATDMASPEDITQALSLDSPDIPTPIFNVVQGPWVR